MEGGANCIRAAAWADGWRRRRRSSRRARPDRGPWSARRSMGGRTAAVWPSGAAVVALGWAWRLVGPEAGSEGSDGSAKGAGGSGSSSSLPACTLALPGAPPLLCGEFLCWIEAAAG
ncbi:Os04g0419400 [Oryza sativa Japonica Group]|uniref:Os04g0419400 protein n=2 Tax=Oryza TaxID=4527 RepID=B9FF53_ORYSJ|nr:hypothetical protein OsJ_14781 [Oryza sativa Japonica Group]BAH92662.1 Os04g0419400 [Oryza sativa Japonica Group]|eukprot:NP_001173934.1 Os04g0419400 [Oryza sativa Japonica Group]